MEKENQSQIFTSKAELDIECHIEPFFVVSPDKTMVSPVIKVTK